MEQQTQELFGNREYRKELREQIRTLFSEPWQAIQMFRAITHGMLFPQETIANPTQALEQLQCARIFFQFYPATSHTTRLALRRTALSL
jgi:hypothetical protein